MKAIQITAPSEMKVVDIEKPALKPGEVLVKIKYVGFCGSDLNTFLGRNPMVKLPVIPGHEVGAIIEAIGKDVPESLKPGMSVTVNPYTNCGKCASCRNGRVNACEHNKPWEYSVMVPCVNTIRTALEQNNPGKPYFSS